MKSPSVVHRSKGPKIGGLKATESAASNRSAVVAIAAENCNVASPNNVEKKPYEPTEELGMHGRSAFVVVAHTRGRGEGGASRSYVSEVTHMLEGELS